MGFANLGADPAGIAQRLVDFYFVTVTVERGTSEFLYADIAFRAFVLVDFE